MISKIPFMKTLFKELNYFSYFSSIKLFSAFIAGPNMSSTNLVFRLSLSREGGGGNVSLKSI